MKEIIVKITDKGGAFFFSSAGLQRSLCTSDCLFDAVKEPQVLKKISRIYYTTATFHILNIPDDMHIIGKTALEVLTELKSNLVRFVKVPK